MSLNITVSTTSILEAELAAINKKSLQTLDANIPASILLTIIGFVSAVGNVLTLLVIYKTKSLHTKCYSLIANLSITDFFVGKLAFAPKKRLV